MYGNFDEYIKVNFIFFIYYIIKMLQTHFCTYLAAQIEFVKIISNLSNLIQIHAI